MEDQNNNPVQDKQFVKVYQQNIVVAAVKPRHLVVPITPKLGDTFFSNGTDFVKLSPGLVGQVLTIANGIPTWGYTTGTGLAASRPATGLYTGYSYFSTDTFVFSVWTGSAYKTTTLT